MWGDKTCQPLTKFQHTISLMTHTHPDRSFLMRFAWLSIGTAIFTITFKALAYLLTDSVGLLSDALESLVNLAGAILALIVLRIAARPADEDHAYGHGKAEYFSSGVEGALILIAALIIIITAIPRLLEPKPIEQVGLGLGVSIIAALINLIVAIILLRAGRRFHSITLEASANHLITDVWTSVGVIVGIGAVTITGWEILDPIIAFLVAGNIVWAGIRIVSKSALGLMDTALSNEEQGLVRKVLEKYTLTGVQYHALRTRQSGSRQFVSFHVLVPGGWTVQRGHRLLEIIEADIRHALPSVTVFTHLESLNDPASWEDTSLDRPETSNIETLPDNPPIKYGRRSTDKKGNTSA